MADDDRQTLAGTAADVAGLSARGQLEWAKMQMFYMPSTWKNVTQNGVRWRGLVLGKQMSGLAGSVLPPSAMKFVDPVLAGGNLGRFRLSNDFAQALSQSKSAFGLPISEHYTGRAFQSFQAGANRIAREKISRMSSMDLFGEVWGGVMGKPGASTISIADEALAAGFKSRGFVAGQAMVSGSKRNAVKNFEKLLAQKHSGATAMKNIARSNIWAGMGVQLAGRAMKALNVGLLVSTVAGIATSVGFAGARLSVNLMNRASQANYMDFGSGMYAAAMSSASVTERQRALEEMQRNNMNARRAIGSEAAWMHA